MTEYNQQFFSGERALFESRDLIVENCIFDEGESPLKESRNITLRNSMFRWKYPLWYCRDVLAEDCVWFDMARAGVWYSDNVTVNRAVIQAPKNFRRCDGLTLSDVTFTNAEETLWSCRNVKLRNVTVKGHYFAMNCEDIDADGLVLDGNYSFDGARNVTVTNSRLLTKDAFWNSENVTVRNCFISGEYLGWNSRNLVLENCTIESLQGMCYIQNLKLINCRLINTTLAFEYSSVDAQITSKVDSVLNPGSGTITAPEIGELIIEKDRVDPSRTIIKCDVIDKQSDRPEWIRR
ncbi:MAG: DUF3737 family protein [Clostridia bacterium]|nr:DUF3737 family protein [Clostridia bacterium]